MSGMNNINTNDTQQHREGFASIGADVVMVVIHFSQP